MPMDYIFSYLSWCQEGLMKWEIKGSLESQLCHMGFYWGKYMKKCIPEVDTG